MMTVSVTMIGPWLRTKPLALGGSAAVKVRIMKIVIIAPAISQPAVTAATSQLRMRGGRLSRKETRSASDSSETSGSGATNVPTTASSIIAAMMR